MAPRRTGRPKQAPVFDPTPSLEFGAQVLQDLGAPHALIGKIAMWYWLDNEADHEFTKDVDFAVPLARLPAIIAALHRSNAEVKQLPIGGVNASIPARGIKTDFIDRSNEEWGNLQPLFLDAIQAAAAGEDLFQGVVVASPEHLVTMKLAAGTERDDRDAVRLIAKIGDLDVTRVRALIKRFLGPALIGRFEEMLRRAGHPQAKRAYSADS